VWGRILALFLLLKGTGAAVHLVRRGAETRRDGNRHPRKVRNWRIKMSVRGKIINDGAEPDRV